ncbi:MAG: hypothetical protein ACXIVQ_14825 [Acidimicrobiales bacterium]
MRRLAWATVLLVVVAACGGDGGGTADPDGSPDPGSRPDGVTITLRTVAEIERDPSGAVVVCPGGFAPCWDVIDTGSVSLEPGWAVVEGDWSFGTLRVTDVGPVESEETVFVDPCGAEDRPLSDGPPVDRVDEELATVLDSVPDRLAAVWLAEGGGPLVLSVTERADELRDELSALGLGGICVADVGADFTLAELEAAQEDTAERFAGWGDAGWVALSSSIESVENRVVISFDEIDQRLRTQIEEEWGDIVRIESFVEVLDGRVDDLAPPVIPGDIPIATQPRQRGGMAALGQFTLRFDGEGDCLYFEDDDGERVKPLWPYGSRALREPPVVVDGRGVALAAVDQEIQVGGGFGQLLPGTDDVSDCGADTVWVIAPE